MSFNYRWYKLPNNRDMAKMDVAPGLIYVVNFIKKKNGTVDCFFYPSVSSQAMMALSDPSGSIDIQTIQEKIYQTLRNVLRDYATKYKPRAIVFSTQFQVQLGKLSSATVPGYSTEFTSGKQTKLVKKH